MNGYIVESFTECSLRFNTLESAKAFADKNRLKVCEVYITDENDLVFIGYGLENENGLMNGKEFNYV